MGHYHCGEGEIEVIECREIRAVPPGVAGNVKADWLVRENIFRDSAEERAFDNGGWKFVYLKEAESQLKPEHLKRVYRDKSDEHLVIFSGRIGVEFDDETADRIAEPREDLGRCHEDLRRCVCDCCDAPIEPDARQYFGGTLYAVCLTEDADPLQSVEQICQVPGVVHAEPDMLWYIGRRTGSRDPQMPRGGRQWHIANTGRQISHSVSGADVKAKPAWNFGGLGHTIGTGITIAVIDTGMDLAHPDLAGGFFELPAGVPRGGHFVLDDDLSTPALEWSFVPRGGLATFPPSPHGTGVAGIALARDNFIGPVPLGVQGIAHGAKLVPIATVPYSVDSQHSLARAIRYATDSLNEEPDRPAFRADIIVVSLGPNTGPFPLSRELSKAIDYATTHGRGGKGTPIFWAVANSFESMNTDRVTSSDNVIAVGKTNAWDVVEKSAYGPMLNFVAPGVDVHTTVSGGAPRWGNYLSVTGTSFAAPCAAGIGALVLQSNPDLLWWQVRDVMQKSCERVGETEGRVVYGADKRHSQYGYGRVDAFAAVTKAVGTPAQPPGTPAPQPLVPVAP